MALSEIRTLLINDPTVSSLVGQKVYIGYADQEAPAPFILLEELFRSPNDCKDAASTIDSYGFIVSAVSPSYPMIESILQAVKDVLNNYEDNMFSRISYSGLSDVYDGTQDYFVKTNNYQTLIRTL
jgi:hypothetical protein